MAGLQLGFTGNLGATAALPPSYAGTSDGATLSSRAYGVTSNGGGGSKTAGLGAVSVGALSLIALTFIWYTLPR